MRAFGDHMLGHRAQALAVNELAETAWPAALDTVAETLTGDESLAPWLIGFASMWGCRDLDDGEVARIRHHVDGVAHRVEA